MGKQVLHKMLGFIGKPLGLEPEAAYPEGGIVFVRIAEFHELEALHHLTVTQIGQQVAPLQAMQDVYRHNPETMWVILRSRTGDRAQAELVGYYGFLHLNAAGFEALENRTLRPRAPDMSLLAPEGERPAAVYIWAIVARRLTALTIPLVGKGLGIKRYGGLPFFATAGTMGGLNGLKGFGFNGASPADDDKLGDLFQFYMPGEADRTQNVA